MRSTPKNPDAVGRILFIDVTGMYLDTLDPFEIPSVATYRIVCPWDESEDERLGAITYIERRTAAQRNKVWYDCPYPFQFLRLSDMCWRVSLSDGTLLSTNVTQATVFLWQNAARDVEGEKVGRVAGNLTTNKTGTAILETWIKAPEAIDCGAWIGFTDYTRDHGRAYSVLTPSLGEWSRYGATVKINGKKVASPKWKKPGQRAGPGVEHLFYVHQLDKIAFEDEEYHMCEQTPVHLEKGWNHVKLTVTMKMKARNLAPWVGTFILLLGTIECPREVPGWNIHFCRRRSPA